MTAATSTAWVVVDDIQEEDPEELDDEDMEVVEEILYQEDGELEEAAQGIILKLRDTFSFSQTCFICFEDYTNDGDNRVVCLPCGHLFCKRCAVNTVKHGKHRKRGRKKGACPNCRKYYETNDLRNIFASKIKMIDTTQLEEMRKQKEEALSLKRATQVELSTEKQKNSDLFAKVRKLEIDLERLRKCNGVSSTGPSTSRRNQLYDSDIFSTGLSQDETSGQLLLSLLCRKQVDICRNGGSRVMDSCGFKRVLLASYSSTNPNSHFSSFGVKNIDINEGRCTSSLHLHSGELRDLKFNPGGDGMVLSASKDKTLKLISVMCNNVVHSYTHDRPVFSCCWKDGEPHYIFCGLQNGKVFLYDTRNSTATHNEPVCEVTDGVSAVPVTSLHWVNRAFQTDASSSGLLVGRLNQCTFYEFVSSSEFLPHQLPFHGNLTSLCYDASSGYFLTSARPKLPEQPQVVHEFCEFCYDNPSADGNSAKYSSRCIQTFTSGSSQPMMTKNVLFAHPFSEQRCVAAVYNHSKGSSSNYVTPLIRLVDMEEAEGLESVD